MFEEEEGSCSYIKKDMKALGELTGAHEFEPFEEIGEGEACEGNIAEKEALSSGRWIDGEGSARFGRSLPVSP